MSMKKVLASKNNSTRVNSKNLNPSTLIEDLSNNVHTENIALDAVINVIEFSNVNALSSKKTDAPEVVIVSSTGVVKRGKAAKPTAVSASTDVANASLLLSDLDGIDSSSSSRAPPVKRSRVVMPPQRSDSDSEDEFISAWTQEADTKLRSAEKLFGDDWNKIAAYLDIGKSAEECSQRWADHVNPVLRSVTADNWSTEEEERLKDLINTQQRGVVSRKINWKLISSEMNRDLVACQAKWRSVLGASMHSGRFTAEEDELIVEQVTKWADRGQGLWKQLEKALNRSAESIYKRYHKRLLRKNGGGEGDTGRAAKRARKEAAALAAITMNDSGDDSDDDSAFLQPLDSLVQQRVKKSPAASKKSKNVVGAGVWTPEMDAQLLEAHAIHGSDWVKIAEHLGNGQTNKQCGLRWNLYVNPSLRARNTGDWSPEDIETLKSLVVEYQTNGQGHKINWTAISREVNRDYNACKNKWKTIVGATMKKGPFTADEDELIIQRVQEWGTKGHGLWTALEKEMGRSLKFIFQRWKLTLAKQVEASRGAAL